MIDSMSFNNNTTFTTPILLLIFNRPSTTKMVFEAIREMKPAKLYVAADGPRANKPGEELKCEEARRIATAVDWDCEVHTLFREDNLGCGRGPASGISWFFEHETEGIILEDDCFPVPSFFWFCSELLERYRNDTRVMQIGGNNLEPPRQREEEYSYTFSNLTYIWGWATWRRAWKYHDFEMNQYREITEKKYLNDYYDTIYEHDFFQYVFHKMHEGDQRTNRNTIWDYQWQFACQINSGLIIVPNRNLVINLGIGDNATHTVDPKGIGHDLILEEIEFPLRHPEFIMVDKQRDRQNFSRMHTSVSSRFKSNVKRIIPKPVLEKMVKPILYMFT
jgi:hypothetical protein